MTNLFNGFSHSHFLSLLTDPRSENSHFLTTMQERIELKTVGM